MGQDTVDSNGGNGQSRIASEASSTSMTENTTTTSPPPSPWRRTYDILTWTPPRCRWDPKNPQRLTLPLNFLFGFAATFTVSLAVLIHLRFIEYRLIGENQVANLYYSHPLLNIFSEDFHVSHEQASIIPTVAQAGYASGLLLLCPLGDLVKRRPLVLVLNFVTVMLTLGICLTTTFNAFVALQFLMSCTTVTPVSASSDPIYYNDSRTDVL
jgi:hypothetical protein